ncbi:MAG: hypothetical protein EZS28_049867 [Streblomastix strix]|uniref:Uncharacterized protein n=1 Tax=Streblomastix strix TaxID=222440 RepID=A0A5J4T840_9EUKA|nr:MAG: hypothetical protein EZS28_049867 [Streblomastix strix]
MQSLNQKTIAEFEDPNNNFTAEELAIKLREANAKRLKGIQNIRLMSLEEPYTFTPACRAVAFSLLLPNEIKQNQLFRMGERAFRTAK